jgi:GNAT superfamily N-acetyltransferase
MPLEIRTSPAAPSLRERIIGALDNHARGAGHPFDVEELAIEAWDGETWQGGLTARVTQRWMFIFLLAVAPEARGRRIGSRLMERAEEEARARNLLGLWLDTYSFQAPGFYAKQGFEEVGRIPDYPPGHARIFLAKRLDGRPVLGSAP